MSSGSSNVQQPAAYSVTSFCEAHTISRALLYKLWKEGKGPHFAKVGRRVLISQTDATAWLERMKTTEQGGAR